MCVQCIVYNVNYAFFVQCNMCVQCKLCILQCTLQSVQCTIDSLHVHCAVNTWCYSPPIMSKQWQMQKCNRQNKLYCTVKCIRCCTALHCSAHRILHCTALHCTALHCTVYTLLHCTELACSAQLCWGLNIEHINMLQWKKGGNFTSWQAGNFPCQHCLQILQLTCFQQNRDNIILDLPQDISATLRGTNVRLIDSVNKNPMLFSFYLILYLLFILGS